MTRTLSQVVSLMVFALGLSVWLAGCGEAPATMETPPGAVVNTVALNVEGMT